jgi:hypothetical protein
MKQNNTFTLTHVICSLNDAYIFCLILKIEELLPWYLHREALPFLQTFVAKNPYYMKPDTSVAGGSAA